MILKIDFEMGFDMAKEFAKAFYNSAAWLKTSKAFAKSKMFLCECCNRPGDLVHHKVWLTPMNINDPYVTLHWSNLQYVCIECHNRIHGEQDTRQMQFDANGQLVAIICEHTPRV